MKLALLALATLVAASPVEVERDNAGTLEERFAKVEFVPWYGRDGKDVCLLAWWKIPSHDCSVGCWNEGYKYFDMTYGENWCCCWARRW
jgi:hypothetical protein